VSGLGGGSRCQTRRVGHRFGESKALAERGLPGDRRHFAVRVSLLFAAVCTIAGTHLPYLPIWLDWVGLSAREIAVVVALPMVVRVIATPVIAFAADRSGDHRRFLFMLACGALAAALVLGQCRNFWPILALSLLFALGHTTMMPLTETVAMGGVRSAGLDYGRMRLWGSVSFIAASFGGGWALDRFGPPAAVWLLVGGAILTALAAHSLPRSAATASHQAAAAGGRRRIGLADALALARSRFFLMFLLAVGAVQAAHAAFYTFGTLHWAAQGLSKGWSGTLWAIGVTVEIGLMAFSGAVVRRVGAARLIVIGAAVSVLRWLAMGFDPPLAALIALQASPTAPPTSARSISSPGPCRKPRRARRRRSTPPSRPASSWAEPHCCPGSSMRPTVDAPTGPWPSLPALGWWRPSPCAGSGLASRGANCFKVEALSLAHTGC